MKNKFVVAGTVYMSVAGALGVAAYCSRWSLRTSVFYSLVWPATIIRNRISGEDWVKEGQTFLVHSR